SANVHLTGSSLTLGPTWDAAGNNLQLTFGSTVTVPAVFTSVHNFISDGSGGTTISGDFSTSGNQTYNNAVTLAGAGATRIVTGVNVNFASTLTGAGKSLTVNGSGTTTFGNTVSGVNALTTDAPGSTVVNGSVSAASVTLNDTTSLNNDVTTTADQTYNGAV